MLLHVAMIVVVAVFAGVVVALLGVLLVAVPEFFNG